jgi:hypothetical protein
MANYRAISTGVASDLARWEFWNGAAWVAAVTLPTLGDDVYSNGFTITLDIDFSANTVRHTAPPNGGSAGGTFTFGAGSTLTADVYGGSGTAYGIRNTTAQRKFIIGNVYSGVSLGAHGTGSGGMDIIGSVFAQGDGIGLAAFTGTPAVYNVYGDAVGSGGGYSYSPAAAVYMAMGVCNVFGRAYATGATSTAAVFAFTGGIINLYEAYRGVGHTNGVMKATTTARIYVQRIVNEMNAIPLVETIAEFGTTILLSQTGPVFVSLNFLRQNSPDETGILLSGTDQADTSDVRSGTVYASGLLTGTCAVPPAASVALNVPVDNTVGSLATAAVVAADLLNEMNNSNLTIAQGLRDGMGASAAAIAAVGSINVIP